ncbi:MAG: TetR/AcrR family transcriptional regulator [Spirochaetes bacterium]|nr:TetR/AcrR family transcriptional regulator [Spirochaetota bacterium]
MRILMPPEKRRDEILDAAESLFAGKGYDNTSTNDILNAAGIARGTLYYHFPSKEDILDGVIKRSCAASLAAAARVASDQTIPLAERLFLTIAAARPESQTSEWMLDELHRPQNALMHEKLNSSLLGGLVPILTDLVIEGISKGVFKTTYPRQSVEMVLSYGSMAFDEEIFSKDEKEGQDQLLRIEAFLHNLELLFGAEAGSLRKLAHHLGSA